MISYGVRRLAMINSGNYVYADIDLSKPVHLKAANNRGKSTLVNALQFLYVNDFDVMWFAQWNHESTAAHYFGHDQSYLVFECQTPTGLQCLLVHGLGILRGNQFERFVYDGAFQKSDYVDDGVCRTFDGVRERLADRHLTKVKNTELWQVLAGTNALNDGQSLPRLNILPIRRREEYIAFRNVFVRLLSLKNANARTLKELIIDSHAREIGERRVDVAVEYKDDFRRAEISDCSVKFIREVAADIDAGTAIRGKLQALNEYFEKTIPLIRDRVRNCLAAIQTEGERYQELVFQLQQEQSKNQKILGNLQQAKGRWEERAEKAREKLNKLQELHQRWSSYSPDFLTQMRQNERQMRSEIAEQERMLDQAARFDLKTLQQQFFQTQRQIKNDRLAIAQWDQTAAAVLRKAGVSQANLDSAFHVLNPELLKLVVGDTVRFKNQEGVAKRIRDIAMRVIDNVYKDDVVEVNISNISGPEAAPVSDPVEFERIIEVKEDDLHKQEFRLNTAKDQEKSQEILKKRRKEYADLVRTLREYDEYAQAWSDREILENETEEADSQVSTVTQEIEKLKSELESRIEKLEEAGKGSIAVKGAKESLLAAVQGLQESLRRLELDMLFVSVADEGESNPVVEPYDSLVTSVVAEMASMKEKVKHIEEGRKQLHQIQTKIEAASRKIEGQQRYFSDAEEEWRQLAEARDSLAEMEAAAIRNWDSLFTTLGAKLNGIVTAVRNIKIAIERINRSLKTYRVSNLRAVTITPEETSDSYAAVESLSSSGGLFHDPGSEEIAKKRLRRMIENQEVISLESLFELRIDIQRQDGSLHRAGSLDEIGSTGTGMTAKTMIFIQLVRAIVTNEKYGLHFYMDGLGELDEDNLSATAAMAVSKGMIPITADPRYHMEPLAHPEVTLYTLAQDPEGKFLVDGYRTYFARRNVELEVASTDEK